LLKLLIIGTTSGDFGGTSVSLMHLLKYLSNQQIDLKHLETGGIRSKNFRSVPLFFKLLRNLYIFSKTSSVISAHLNNTAIPILGPFIYFISKINNIPYSIRIFGGKGYSHNNFIIKYLISKVLKNSSMYFAQTTKLYNTAKKDHIKVTWFPTTRPKTHLKINNKECRKITYIGRIIKEKGIFEILYASKIINSGIRIDIYGPLQDGTEKSIFKEYNNVKYKGIINPNNIYRTLVKYDLLLFPSYYDGEGYPGIIIEALNVGMPIICTNWLTINDLIDSNSAIIIKHKDYIGLAESINYICENSKLYRKLCQGAKRRSLLFSMEKVYNNFIKVHEKLVINE